MRLRLTLACLVCALQLWLAACAAGSPPAAAAPSAGERTLTPDTPLATGAPTPPVIPPTQAVKATLPITLTAAPTLAAGALMTPTQPTLPAGPAAQPPVCSGSQAARVEKGQLASSLLPDPLLFRVFLPPCYTRQPHQNYPVLYLFHGQFSNDDQWERLGVDEVAARLVISGELPAFIIVMPFDRGIISEPDTDKFGDAVARDLVPYIDHTYRTLPDRAFRAVGGLSRGAGWALHLGLQSWQLFGAIGLHSPAIFWVDTPFIPRWLDAIPAGSLPRISIDLGDRDAPEITASAQWFEDLLTQRNILHEWYLFHGYHEETYWQSHLEIYLRWYGADW